MKKTILKCGLLATAAIPVLTIISCNDNGNKGVPDEVKSEVNEVKSWNLGEVKLDDLKTFNDFQNALKVAQTPQKGDAPSALKSYLESELQNIKKDLLTPLKSLDLLIEQLKNDFFILNFSFNDKTSSLIQNGDMYVFTMGFLYKWRYKKTYAERDALILKYTNVSAKFINTNVNQIFKHPLFNEWVVRQGLTLKGFIEHQTTMFMNIASQLKKQRFPN